MKLELNNNLVLILLLPLVACVSTVDAAELILHERASGSGTMIRLGDVADIAATTPEEMRRLATTPLMPAPAPGTSQFLRRSQLRDLLFSQGIELNQLSVSGAQVIEISDALPPSKKPAEKSLPQTWPAEKAAKPLPMAVVTLRKIESGELIRATDLELRAIEGHLSSGALTSLEGTIGMEARQTLSAGAIVLKNQLRAPLQVLRGETVTVYARTGGISVKTFATARQDGALGDLVLVETLDKTERYTAEVSGRRELEVLATGSEVRELATLNRRTRR